MSNTSGQLSDSSIINLTLPFYYINNLHSEYLLLHVVLSMLHVYMNLVILEILRGKVALLSAFYRMEMLRHSPKVTLLSDELGPEPQQSSCRATLNLYIMLLLA